MVKEKLLFETKKTFLDCSGDNFRSRGNMTAVNYDRSIILNSVTMMHKISWDNVSMLFISFYLGPTPTAGQPGSQPDLNLRTTRRARLPQSLTKTRTGAAETHSTARTCHSTQSKIRQFTPKATSSKVNKHTSIIFFKNPPPRTNPEERLPPACQRTTWSADPLPAVRSLPTEPDKGEAAPAQEGSAKDAKSAKGEPDELCGRAGVRLHLLFNRTLNWFSGGRSKLSDPAPCAASRKIPCPQLSFPARRSRRTQRLPSSVLTEPRWRPWPSAELPGLVGSPPIVSALPARYSCQCWQARSKH